MFGLKKKICSGSFAPDFQNTMMLTKLYLDDEKSTDDKIILLESILQTIKNDLQYDLLSEILYKSNGEPRKIFPFIYVGEVLDEYGTPVEYMTDFHTTIDLEKDCVLIMPWECNRWERSMINIRKNNFKYDHQNHFAYYYSFMDITHVYNGNHSISAGITNKKGIIYAKVVSVETLFPHIYCDYKNIYNIHTDRVIDQLFDFRIGLIFEISKLKHNLMYSMER